MKVEVKCLYVKNCWVVSKLLEIIREVIQNRFFLMILEEINVVFYLFLCQNLVFRIERQCQGFIVVVQCLFGIYEFLGLIFSNIKENIFRGC